MRDLPGPDEVLGRTCFTAVSAGTERANLIGERHVYGGKILDEVIFPRALGYSGTGIVEKVGDAVTRLKVGQRVVIYFGQHKQYNIVPVTHAFPIEDDRVGREEAALAVIACFPCLASARRAWKSAKRPWWPVLASWASCRLRSVKQPGRFR